MIYSFIKIIKNSGIIIPKFIVRHILSKDKIPKYFLFIKIDPLFLKEDLSSNHFSKVLSKINVGDMYKTVSKNRNKILDSEIGLLLSKNEKYSFAEIGCSDGSGSIQLFEQYKSKFTHFDLYDYFTGFDLFKMPCLTFYCNQNHRLVYLKVLFFLFYLYPLKLNFNFKNDFISFDNSCLIKNNLKIQRADIFNHRPSVQYDIVKCSNLLNSVYLSEDEIIKAVNNLKSWLNENGYLFVGQNNRKYHNNEAMVLFKKINGKLIISKEINNHDILNINNLEG